MDGASIFTLKLEVLKIMSAFILTAYSDADYLQSSHMSNKLRGDPRTVSQTDPDNRVPGMAPAERLAVGHQLGSAGKNPRARPRRCGPEPWASTLLGHQP